MSWLPKSTEKRPCAIHLAKFFARLPKAEFAFENVSKYLKEGAFVRGDLIQREENLGGKSDYIRLEATVSFGRVARARVVVLTTTSSSMAL